jgi:hypothetical protein
VVVTAYSRHVKSLHWRGDTWWWRGDLEGLIEVMQERIVKFAPI